MARRSGGERSRDPRRCSATASRLGSGFVVTAVFLGRNHGALEMYTEKRLVHAECVLKFLIRSAFIRYVHTVCFVSIALGNPTTFGPSHPILLAASEWPGRQIGSSRGMSCTQWDQGEFEFGPTAVMKPKKKAHHCFVSILRRHAVRRQFVGLVHTKSRIFWKSKESKFQGTKERCH